MPCGSPWKSLAKVLSSVPFLAFLSLVVTLLVWRIRSAGDLPLVTHFPLTWFLFSMPVVWMFGFWLDHSYEIAYELDPATHGVYLTRTLVGRSFRIRLAELAQVCGVAVETRWWDSKGNRHWEYALCLVTSSCQIVRVSSFSSLPPNAQAHQVAEVLSLPVYPCPGQEGVLKVKADPSGTPVVFYAPPSEVEHPGMEALRIACFVTLGFLAFLLLMTLRHR